MSDLEKGQHQVDEEGSLEPGQLEEESTQDAVDEVAAILDSVEAEAATAKLSVEELIEAVQEISQLKVDPDHLEEWQEWLDKTDPQQRKAIYTSINRIRYSKTRADYDQLNAGTTKEQLRLARLFIRKAAAKDILDLPELVSIKELSDKISYLYDMVDALVEQSNQARQDRSGASEELLENLAGQIQLYEDAAELIGSGTKGESWRKIFGLN